jgi:regulator of sigma E protease
MSLWLGVLIGFLLLMLLVVVHELGHFWMARKNGVEVVEFGIGMPPAAVKWQKRDGKWRKLKKSEWEKAAGKSLILSLNWLPLGGFCLMKGESDADKRKNSFGQASLWGKTKILFGGVVANWLFAIVVLTVLAWAGMPLLMNGQFKMDGGTVESDNAYEIHAVKEGSAAEAAGIGTEDKIVWLGTEADIVTWNTNLSEWTAAHAGQEVQIGVERDGEVSAVDVTMGAGGEGSYYLGVETGFVGGLAPIYRSEWWQAPIVGVVTTVQLTGETFRGVGEMLWNLVAGVFKQANLDDNVREEGREEISKAGDSVSGPVGIVGVIFPAFASAGALELAFLTALISISLACMNVLPIPALDGGRWSLIMAYRLRGKALETETEQKVVGTSFLVLMGIFVVITVLDVMRFF